MHMEVRNCLAGSRAIIDANIEAIRRVHLLNCKLGFIQQLQHIQAFLLAYVEE